MSRWRYSLRTFLFVVVAATALTSLAANHLLRCRRVRQSQEWLESQGVDCQLYRKNRFDEPYFWELPSRVHVNIWIEKNDLLAPLHWNHVNQLGPLITLEVGEEEISHEFHQCLRAHRNTLRMVGVSYGKLSTESGLAISECRQLMELRIKADSGEATFHLQPMPKLEDVFIWAEGLRDEDLAWLPEQPNLSRLTLFGPHISPELINTICRCQSLKELIFLYPRAMNADDVRKLIAIPTLQRMHIPPVFLSSGVVDEILASSLVDVNIASSRIATTDLRRLMACERLQRITIRLGMLDGPWLPVNRSSPLRVAVEADDQLTTDRICQIVTRCLRPDSGTVIFNIGYGVPGYELFECEAVKEIGPGMMDDPPWLNFP